MERRVRCYMVCASPRTGSWLLCHALEGSGLAGVPAEYFWRGDEVYWRARWGVQEFDDYLNAFLRTATPNGVAGTKMMWAYFFDFIDRVRQLPGLACVDHDELMEKILPRLQYLWVRRQDKVREGISWWRAVVTGEWAVASGRDSEATAPAALNLNAVRQLVEVAAIHERAWSDYFTERGIEPWTIDYEDLIIDVDGSLDSALRYLGVHPGRPVRAAPVRMRRQADDQTERWVEEYQAAEGTGLPTSMGGSSDVMSEPTRSRDRAHPCTRRESGPGPLPNE